MDKIRLLRFEQPYFKYSGGPNTQSLPRTLELHLHSNSILFPHFVNSSCLGYIWLLQPKVLQQKSFCYGAWAIFSVSRWEIACILRVVYKNYLMHGNPLLNKNVSFSSRTSCGSLYPAISVIYWRFICSCIFIAAALFIQTENLCWNPMFYWFFTNTL